MIAALRTATVMLDDDDETPGFWLNVNDTFCYACADVEEITEAEIPAVYWAWKNFGWEGVVCWVWRKRGTARFSFSMGFPRSSTA
jgi:hypothetical protein